MEALKHYPRGHQKQYPARVVNGFDDATDGIETLPREVLSDDEDDGNEDGVSSEYSYTNRRRPQGRSRQRVRTIDWRAEICQAFKLDFGSKDSILLEHLDNAADRLEEADRLAALALEARDTTPVYQIVNRIACASEQKQYLYLGQPFVVNSGPLGSHLRGSDEIHNYELFLEKNKALSFIGYKDYSCCEGSRSSRGHSSKSLDLDPETLLVNESVSIISPEFCSALKTLAQVALVGIPHPEFDIESEFPSPYLWWFHGRDSISKFDGLLETYHQQHIDLFQLYVDQRLHATWEAVDALLARGEISAQYIHYLYVPNTILVAQTESEHFGQHLAYFATSWLNLSSVNAGSNSMKRTRREFAGSIDGMSWAFDGNFQRKSTRLFINSLPSMTETFKIQNLKLYPIEYAPEGLEAALRDRGEMFWKCRHRNYVCYTGESSDGIQSNSDPRFMIDISTYQQMHEGDSNGNQQRNKDDLGPDIMAKDTPPTSSDFLLCLPKTIPGFNMNKKEWTSLDVSRIIPVRWNTEAFDSLVVDKETKELISALVTNQIDAEKGTDLMSGKGNGLFILLHGGPGTGKTLTAESVAEFSEKPLYRVTCGDIGTKAEEVEKYLEVVMLLGKTWGCVVLLDEADVFLEQRRIFDLQRNALVSVFLRVLEYYDGILILTSNRVGIFDEAFKSRIQLTLRYKTLEAEQRLMIWRNFITRLENLQNSGSTRKSTRARGSERASPDGYEAGGRRVVSANRHSTSIHGGVDLGIKVNEVREKLDQLAEAKLNGREIRNAVSTARQLAMFRKEPMGYEHLRIVIEEAKKFDSYLLELNRGLSRDQIMEERGERLRDT